MKKLLLAGVVGGLLMFVWSAVAWMALPLHTSTILSMAKEDSVIAVMKIGMDRKSVYMFPARPASGDQAALDLWKRKFAQGPVGMVVYNPAGGSDLMLGEMGIGLLDSMLTALLAAWLLSRSTAAKSGYFTRVMFCGTLGLFICLAVHVMNWNWLMYPVNYTTGWIADSLIAWVIGGIGIAGFVKAPAI
jgi:hypothetical protein